MKVGGEKMVRTEKEVQLPEQPTIAKAPDDPRYEPAMPTLRRPGEDAPTLRGRGSTPNSRFRICRPHRIPVLSRCRPRLHHRTREFPSRAQPTPLMPRATLAAPHLCRYTGIVKIALGQINPTVGDFQGNASKIIEFSQRAQASGAGLILFPEMSVCGYPPRDLVERGSFVVHCREATERIASETTGIAVICGLATPAQAETGKSVMNSAALLKDGRIAFLQSKMLLPTYDVFDEMRNFAAAKSQVLFPFCGKQMALTICEDAWNDKHFWNKRLYTFDPVEALIHAGGNFLLNISASPFWMGKRDVREICWRTIATSYNVPVADGEPGGRKR